MATDFKLYEQPGGPGEKPRPTRTQLPNNFGPNAFTPLRDGGGWLWNDNQEVTLPIIFIGDKSGKYIANPVTTEGAKPGSPLTVNGALNLIINERMSKPGAILELKQMLLAKQIYSSPEAGQQSIDAGNTPDILFVESLQFALQFATNANIQLAASGEKYVMSLDEYLAKAPMLAGPGWQPSGGDGGPTRNVTYKKYRTEDFDIAIDQMFQQTIGRGASDQELKDFVSKLQAYDSENPEVTSSTGPASNRTTTTSGGMSPDIVASRMRDQALADPEAEGYNKATKYLSYFKEALQAPQELGR